MTKPEILDAEDATVTPNLYMDFCGCPHVHILLCEQDNTAVARFICDPDVAEKIANDLQHLVAKARGQIQ